MYQAAALGHYLSMAKFAMSPPFGERLTLEDADLIMLHRQHAMPFLQAAASNGEPTALYGLFRAHALGYIGTVYGRLAVTADPVQAVAVGAVLRRIADPGTAAWVDTQVAIVRSTLTAAQRHAADALSAAYGRRFRGHARRDFSSGVFGPDIGRTCVALDGD